MKYYKVEMGNGYCGCDDNFVVTTDDDTELSLADCMEMYVYADGAAGISPDDEEFAEYPYEENVADNSTWEEITEEEYRKLVDEEYWEEISY
jgi:hypothetical protein